MSNRILYIVNDPGFFVSHRLPVALAARKAGYEVHVAAGPGVGAETIQDSGVTYHSLPLSRSGRNPLREAHTLSALVRLMARLRPDVVHLVTIKPVLYGGLAARVCKVPAVVAAISGLGLVFTATGLWAALQRKLVGRLYRVALGHPNLKVICQNPDDLARLTEMGAVAEKQSVLVPGSGVGLQQYRAEGEPGGELPVVLFAARMLKDKGVVEFVEAARLLRAKGVAARFVLAGDADPENPRSVLPEQLAEWRVSGVVEWLGYQSDMATVMAASSIVVLPSYYGEGLPKVLIEAAACGRAVITTDHPGCRDAIVPDVTGLLVPVRNVEALGAAMELLIRDSALRQQMGEAGRELAERRYDINAIVQTHIDIYNDLTE